MLRFKQTAFYLCSRLMTDQLCTELGGYGTAKNFGTSSRATHSCCAHCCWLTCKPTLNVEGKIGFWRHLVTGHFKYRGGGFPFFIYWGFSSRPCSTRATLGFFSSQPTARVQIYLAKHHSHCSLSLSEFLKPHKCRMWHLYQRHFLRIDASYILKFDSHVSLIRLQLSADTWAECLCTFHQFSPTKILIVLERKCDQWFVNICMMQLQPAQAVLSVSFNSHTPAAPFLAEIKITSEGFRYDFCTI